MKPLPVALPLRGILLAVLFAASLLSGCTGDGGTPGAAGEGCNKWLKAPVAFPQPVVVLETSMGTIEAEICIDAVPITAQNFLDHVRSGVYDGTKFHRIIDGFMMQGGDPATKKPPGARATDIPDEFHWKLRHDGRGVLSMANAGPNTGSSQFFITFGQTPHLDDGHPVFGQVVRGFDVLDKVEKVGSKSGTPTQAVTLAKATVREPSDAERQAALGDVSLALWSPDATHQVPSDGGRTQFLLVAESTANHIVTVATTHDGPTGLTVGIEDDFLNFPLPAHQRVVFLVDVQASEAASSPSTFSVTIAAANATATEELVVERSSDVGPGVVENGDSVRGNYIGMMVDGRLFDTSVSSVANDPKVPKHTCFQLRGSYIPFQFTVGSGVIQGFTDLAIGTPVGGKSSDRIPQEDAYGPRGDPCKPQGTVATMAGKNLLFQLEILEIDEAAS